MLRLLFLLLVAFFASAVDPACAQPEVRRVNCNASHQRDLDLTPRTAGPLRLASVYCQAFSAGSSLLFGAPLLSPDAQSIAYYAGKAQLRVARLNEAKGWTAYPAALGPFARFGSNFRSVYAFAWRSDSKGVWTGNHETARGGFPASPLQPVVAEDGGLTLLPLLERESGPLDGLLWIGGDGLALAQFGTRGSYYRPAAHDDPAPALAVVDAQRGVVLDTLPFSMVDSLENRNRAFSPFLRVRDAAATLHEGKVRALIDIGFDEWLVWTQGGSLRVLANPYGREMHNRMAISPDGARVLVGRFLRTDGGWCSTPGGCRPGQPVEGVLAALHDIDTGALVWSIRATVTVDLEFPTPAISPDGHYALVGLVPEDRALVALVSMRDGAIVQTIPAPGGAYAMGFAQGGRTVWTYAYGVTALYALQP
ncbi:MAG TPA: hypothetical protein VN803_05130 [Gemmatimonadales bacterium]|nr:hypothetical protein [Gemmatimonadales bacterium]